MSAGKNLLRSIIDEDQPKLLRRAREEFFNEDEVPAYHFVKGYLDQYGSLPSLGVLTAEGHLLPPLRRAAVPGYHLDLLRRRYAYKNVNDRHPQLVECMKNMDSAGMLSTLREMTAAAASSLEDANYTTLGEEMEIVRDDYLEAKFNPGLRGVPFGWRTLDNATSGALGGDLIVVAGRPSLGKSWKLLFMAQAARLYGKVVAFTSMEMSKLQIARRWLGLHMGVNPNFIKEGELSSAAEARMMAAISDIQDMVPAHLLAGDMSKQVGGVENMIVEYNPDIVFVDAAYLLSPSGRKKGYISRWESVSEVVRELKTLALKYNKPIVISVQFNRNQKSSGKGELDLGDIAGSDSIPQDASIVLGIRRGPAPFQDAQRIITVMKNRDGITPRLATAFTFTPVNFSEVPLIEDGQAQTTADTYDSSWMS